MPANIQCKMCMKINFTLVPPTKRTCKKHVSGEKAGRVCSSDYLACSPSDKQRWLFWCKVRMQGSCFLVCNTSKVLLTRKLPQETSLPPKAFHWSMLNFCHNKTHMTHCTKLGASSFFHLPRQLEALLVRTNIKSSVLPIFTRDFLDTKLFLPFSNFLG